MKSPRKKQQPAPVRLQQVIARMRQRHEAEFASALQASRLMWRRYRTLVEAPRFPRRFAEAFQQYYRQPVSISSRAAIFSGEEIFHANYEKRLRKEAEEFLKRRKAAKPRSGRSR